MKNPFLSLVIPAYNEEEIIEKSLQEVLKYLNKQKYSWEVIVVSDGSTDDTVKIFREFKNKKIEILVLKKNQGKGAALRKGILAAKGEKIIFTDADLSVSLKYTKDLLKALKTSDVAIASRRVKGAVIKVHQPFIREFMGRVFTKLTQLVLLSNIKDFTCGFKGFNKKPAKKIFENSLIDRWAYDSEIIFLAKKYDYSVKQVPIKWINRFESRVRIGNAATKALIDLLTIRLNDLKGLYAN